MAKNPAAAAPAGKRRQLSVLISSTFAFTICFAVWMMFAVLGIPIKNKLGLNDTQFGLLAAMPVLSGSLIRVPLGIWTDRFGGRIVFFVLMLVSVAPIYLISSATAYWHFLVLGLFVGLAGGSFSVGTPYVARWYEKERRGLAMGIFGAGNSGSALTKFVAPAIIAAFGWQMLPKVYAGAMLATALLFWLFSYTDATHRAPSGLSFGAQMRVLKDPRVWRYCQYYSVV
ncbi:MAG TPA: MFS transporter, partial [Janthinobacterium sp.]|nr:MFS transporter [Janthinobacterium sp.]